jgi:hypothetical protein
MFPTCWANISSSSSKPFSQAGWGRLDMKPHINIRKPKEKERRKKSKERTSKLGFWHMDC